MIDIMGIPVVAARLAAAEKKKRMKQRRETLKVSRMTIKGEVRTAAVRSAWQAAPVG